jgi:hypothetical protein
VIKRDLRYTADIDAALVELVRAPRLGQAPEGLPRLREVVDR